jgi:hypothetical protein
MRMTIASPMPTSAAATAITNNANTCPSIPASWNIEEKATRLMFTAFSISSIERRISTAFCRASTP